MTTKDFPFAIGIALLGCPFLFVIVAYWTISELRLPRVLHSLSPHRALKALATIPIQARRLMRRCSIYSSIGSTTRLVKPPSQCFKASSGFLISNASVTRKSPGHLLGRQVLRPIAMAIRQTVTVTIASMSAIESMSMSMSASACLMRF